MVYRWPGHVVVARKTGDWKCPVEDCEYVGVLTTLEWLGKHLVSHGCLVDEEGTIEEGARRHSKLKTVVRARWKWYEDTCTKGGTAH
jgi:hypothetical protein